MIEAANNSTFPRRSEDRKLFILRAMLDNAPTVHDAETLHSDICSSTSLLVDKEPIRIHGAYINRVLKEYVDTNFVLLFYQCKNYNCSNRLSCAMHMSCAVLLILFLWL